MTVGELITALYSIDPSGKSQVRVWISRKNAKGLQRDLTVVRRFLEGGAVILMDRDHD